MNRVPAPVASRSHSPMPTTTPTWSMASRLGGSHAVTRTRSVASGIPKTFVRTSSWAPSPRSDPTSRIQATSGIHDACRSQSVSTSHTRVGSALRMARSSNLIAPVFPDRTVAVPLVKRGRSPLPGLALRLQRLRCPDHERKVPEEPKNAHGGSRPRFGHDVRKHGGRGRGGRPRRETHDEDQDAQDDRGPRPSEYSHHHRQTRERDEQNGFASDAVGRASCRVQDQELPGDGETE